MPTGFTCEIENGITFEKFAINCARAFGALIHMRDEPADTPVPNEIKPDSYHVEELKKAEKALALAKKMTLKEAEILAKRDYEKSIKENSEAIKRKKELKEKYDKMLQQAKNWQPPTPDHLNFKNFMIEQISSSMDFDCNAHYYYENKPVLETPKKYREEHIKGCEHDIKYHSEHYQKEVEGCAKRTKWIQDLKRALNKE